jgi:hypothetical protein
MDRKTTVFILVVLALVVLCAAGVAVSGQAGADPPRSAEASVADGVGSKISYQGRLTDDQGSPLNGTYSMAFRLYDGPSGGTLVWDGGPQNVQVQEGLFSVQLGVPQGRFNGRELWLEIVVGAEVLTPRQEILPAPYALSLRPGATISATLSGAILHAENTAPNGRGIRGYATARTGTNYGVVGASRSPDGYGGYFYNNGAHGAGLFARGATDDAPDLVLGGGGGDDGRIYSDPDQAGSDILLFSNDEVWIDLDEDDNSPGNFVIRNGADTAILRLNEAGDLWVGGTISSGGVAPRSVGDAGAACVRVDVSHPGERAIDLPAFCLDQICSVWLWTDATMGAFGPGLSWPVSYMQDAADNTWIGGPNLAIGGVTFSAGAGLNGDTSKDAVFLGGQTSGGGYARLLDDGAAESSVHQWTIDFNPVVGELSQASFLICPNGGSAPLQRAQP